MRILLVTEARQAASHSVILMKAGFVDLALSVRLTAVYNWFSGPQLESSSRAVR